MNESKLSRLFASIWTDIDRSLSTESRTERLQFISSLLQCFSRAGVDITQLSGIDEDIREYVDNLGAIPKPRVRQKGVFVFDTSGLDDPVPYEFVGGPLDGSSMSLGSGIHELPPDAIHFESLSDQTRMDGRESYRLTQMDDFDKDGNCTGSYWAYLHKANP